MDFKTKTILFSILILKCFSFELIGQAKKPILMAVPSDLYCQEHGYVTRVVNDGVVEIVPDYSKAFKNDPDLLVVTTAIGQIMADRGFPLKSLEMEMKSLSAANVEDAMLTSKTGSDMSESPYDKIRKRAKCDIILGITWKINHFGPKKSITFVLQGLDAYTNKQIAACQGTGPQSYSAELPILLEEAVINFMPQFEAQLQNHFNDLFNNGREITLKCRKWNDSEWDFESETGNGELGFVIEDWVSNNTVNGSYNVTEATENVIDFNQVRIPMYNEKGRAIDARNWVRELARYLSSLGVPSKLITKGLGEVQLIIGGK